MASNFQSDQSEGIPKFASPLPEDPHTDQFCEGDRPWDFTPDILDKLDTMKRDRFELLSAYLDSEVTAAERRQVEEWLATDAVVQRLHTRLLQLRLKFQDLPIAPCPFKAEQRVQQTVEHLYTQVDRNQARTRLLGGVVAVTTLFLAGLLSVWGGDRAESPQLAQAPAHASKTKVSKAPSMDPDALVLALNQPIVKIPASPSEQTVMSNVPMVQIDRPVIQIPKAAVIDSLK